MLTDTIAAIATANGVGAIGIVRLSGPAAIEVADKVFCAAQQGMRLVSAPSHKLLRGIVRSAEGVTLDDCLAVVMRQPGSYTGEDTVEFHCHGSLVVLRSLLSTLLACGARAATAGEFTRRAFVNGKLDLVQVEAVGDLLTASSEAGVELAAGHLTGMLSQRFGTMREKLVGFLAHVHAAIDYPDEVPDVTPAASIDTTQDVLAEAADLLREAEHGIRLRAGVDAVIVGKPNVGKSSLLNALLRTQRAIVTPVAGTTRDVIEESLELAGVAFRISDTAGIRQTEDPVENEGVVRALRKLDDADLTLAVFDASQPLDQNDWYVLEQVKERQGLAIWNKSDLPACLDESDFHAIPVVKVSAKSGVGLQNLEEAMVEVAGVNVDRQLQKSGRALLFRPRQVGALRGVAFALRQVLEGARKGHNADCLAAELEEALWYLGELTGETTPDEIVDEIFRRFCVGK